jgi:protein-disulfide isomerase
MLATKLAALLLALPLALAQDASASAEVTPSAEFTTAEAVPAADVSPTETAEAVEASIATPTSTASGNVGANIANTGNGETSGSGNWSLVEFTAPSREHYCECILFC